MMDNDVMVSVCCLTYNHAPFIRQALDSFIGQKFNCKYEIIVYDDNSTDGTKEILRRYGEKYPDKIRLFLSEVNNYRNSPGRMFITYLIPNANGKYVALCEGDDYWTDMDKLQKQFDYMEHNMDCSVCFHDAQVCDMDGTLISDTQLEKKPYYKKASDKYSCEEILQLDFYPTASIFFRAELLKKMTLPEYFYNGICGDLPLRITLGSLGKSYCFNESMSAYRIGNPQSASGKIIGDNSKITKTLDGHIGILKSFDKWSSYKFHGAVEKTIQAKEIEKCVLTGNIKGLHTIGLKNCSYKQIIKCYVSRFFPYALDYFRLAKRKLKCGK